MCDILASAHGEGEFRHSNGEMSTVRLEAARQGTNRVRFANMPPEVPDRVVKTLLERYSEVKEIQAETWSQAYRYTVEFGIRATVVTLLAHIPSTY
jgi:hypothetical protein